MENNQRPVFKAPQIPIQPKTETASKTDPFVAGQTKPYQGTAKQAQQNNLPTDNFASAFNLPMSIFKKNTVIGVLCGVLFIGLLLGATIFGGGSVSVQGLSNFVLNPEVPAGRYRCGVVERTQGCVIYIMNPSRTDKKGKDFYADAARFTGVPESTIQLGNIEYASRIIPPGYIAQINIPSTN